MAVYVCARVCVRGMREARGKLAAGHSAGAVGAPLGTLIMILIADAQTHTQQVGFAF